MNIRNFEQSRIFDGDEVKITDVLDKTVIIKDFRVFQSKYYDNDYMVVQIENNGKLQTFSTSSEVLKKQLEDEKNKGLPIRALITKEERYYCLKPPVKKTID